MNLFPNAKINIGLNVLEKRPDNYHNIETVFYPIGLKDSLIVSESTASYLPKSAYTFKETGMLNITNPEQNLVIKALRLLQEDFDIEPVDIELTKHIPAGAGLGGGSSDAAFMLKALNELFQLKISTEGLEKYATKLGADCAFFVRNKPVLATGIGNVFQPIQLDLSGYHLVLVKPDIFVYTPEAYASIHPQHPEIPLLERTQEPIENWRNTIKNDFELPVFAKYPLIKEIKEHLYDLGAVYAAMSGSGSSVYGLFKHPPKDLQTLDKYFVFVENLS